MAKKKYGNHNFSLVPQANIQRSSFNRSSQVKTTMNGGFLTPIFVDEVLPGDTFNMQTVMFGRLATPLVPIMDNIYLDMQYFFVPTRLVWENFQKFHGEQDNPNDPTDFTIPTIKSPAGGFEVGSIADYFGLPTSLSDKTSTIEVSALPFRAYNLIYNEWYRDQNLIESVKVEKGDTDDYTNYKYKFNGNSELLLRRGKRHDYFTSCLPWAQKGEGIGLPLSAVGSIVSDGSIPNFSIAGYSNVPIITDNVNDKYNSLGTNYVDTYSSLKLRGTTEKTAQGLPLRFGDNTGLKIDLSTANYVSINTMREAFQLQRLLERDARGGTRYTEIIRSHFGVISPDARLQRPEYLGGGSTRINIKQVENNSDKQTGELGAFGIVADSNGCFAKSFTEHGYIIGIASIRADLTYQQGINRMWSRQTRFDFYYPALAHLGEQEVLNKEIYAQGDKIKNAHGELVDDEVFGYQERYAEYRYKPNLITGKLRSTDPQSLDVWHLSQDFLDLPKLSPEFISENPPIDRIVAVQNEPHFILDCYFRLITARPMPVYGIPGYIDHF